MLFLDDDDDDDRSRDAADWSVRAGGGVWMGVDGVTCINGLCRLRSVEFDAANGRLILPISGDKVFADAFTFLSDGTNSVPSDDV